MAQLEVSGERCSGSPHRNPEHHKDFPSFSSTGSSTSAEIPVIFSVFYGKPQHIQSSSFSSSLTLALEHASFEARVSSTFIEHARKTTEEPRGRIWERRKHRRDCDSVQFKELASLASTYHGQILGLWGDRYCAMCESQPATAIVYQPICCTYEGYCTLVDGDKLFALMLSIAKLVVDLDSDAKVRSAIGSNGYMTYINGLAVPVCSTGDACRKEANSDIVTFLKQSGFGDSQAGDEGRFEGNESHSEEREKDDQQQTPWPLLQRRPTLSSKFATDLAMFRDAVEADEWEDDDVSDDSEDIPLTEPPCPSVRDSSPTYAYMHERIPLRYMSICGQPILSQSHGPIELDAGRLTCFVFTSRWEADLLESATRTNNDPEAYHIIAAFHERFIMAAAEFRCCICPSPVLASTMVHCPISFRRNFESSPCTLPHRKSMIRLLQYTAGKWTYPEAKAALGYDGIWQISDFVVPICQRKSLCEETARIAARHFIDSLFAESAEPCYRNLTPDTDLLSAYWVENSGKTPKMVVKRIGLGLFTDTRDEDTEVARAEEILRNKEAIERTRLAILTKRKNNDAAAVVTKDPDAMPSNVKVGGNVTDTCLSKPQGESIRDGEKIYTYIIEEESAIAPEAAEEKGISTWGGYPLCEESAKLVAAGFHDSSLMKPMITMDVLKTLKDTKESIKERTHCMNARDI